MRIFLFLLISVFFVACGGDVETTVSEQPPNNKVPPAPVDTAFLLEPFINRPLPYKMEGLLENIESLYTGYLGEANAKFLLKLLPEGSALRKNIALSMGETQFTGYALGKYEKEGKQLLVFGFLQSKNEEQKSLTVYALSHHKFSGMNEMWLGSETIYSEEEEIIEEGETYWKKVTVKEELTITMNTDSIYVNSIEMIKKDGEDWRVDQDLDIGKEVKQEGSKTFVW